MLIRFTVNDVQREVDVDPMMRLLTVIRSELGLTGTKDGCSEGECGACSVLIDGELVNSCLVPACQIDGTEVITIESPTVDSVRRHFTAGLGVQCGFCTPGMVMAIYYWISECKRTGVVVDAAGARQALGGNLCRCTGYQQIIEVALNAARAEERC